MLNSSWKDSESTLILAGAIFSTDYNQFLLRKVNKKILVKIWEIQVIVFIIMLTRSSKRIFNLLRYTGILNSLMAVKDVYLLYS